MTRELFFMGAGIAAVALWLLCVALLAWLTWHTLYIRIGVSVAVPADHFGVWQASRRLRAKDAANAD